MGPPSASGTDDDYFPPQHQTSDSDNNSDSDTDTCVIEYDDQDNISYDNYNSKKCQIMDNETWKKSSPFIDCNSDQSSDIKSDQSNQFDQFDQEKNNK